AGGVSVTAGAALELDGASGALTITNEALTLNGTGPLTTGLTALGVTAVGPGALRNLAGNNSLVSSTGTGTVVTVNTNPAGIGVDSGSSLMINGVVAGGGNGLLKSGTGALTLAGGGANTYTGQTTVNEGTLILDKTTGVAIAGALLIGDDRG